MKTRIRLSQSEIYFAATIGVMRQVTNLKNARQNAHGFGGDEWQVHVEGCLGEMAVAKYLGMYWNGAIGNLGVPDVGNLQVRTTAVPNGHLIVRPGENGEDVFLLVVGKNGNYRLAGWRYGEEVQYPTYFRDTTNRSPCYMMPQKDLFPMETLK